MPRESKRQKLLEAAALIVTEQGSDALTLDAVAKRAEVSKGGLLYHFSTKEALVKGLVQYMNDIYRENVEELVEKDDGETGKWARSFINVMHDKSKENRTISAGMLAAQGINPKLLKPLQDTYADWQNHIEHDGIDQVDATIMRLAVDGLWLSEIFGLGPLPPKLRERVLERLLEQTYE
ncbi:TetR family transcriptional regulator [Thalassobacillus devorans]|uniref:TetR family transcriptional regulator n=1 Tax=Thalassobacillus devorans TaxID=279813 RepID=A0ABQ1NI23_9BACI|nr:TetR/AcrR family transcriptional regulator [Thalassobacillus devorans]NIK27435.1 AcrR family transcriptional regulator [Thalassobacillus devorans]GGC77685.1 TetR family transcriptional regulator [Thalassobacillus devorans]